MCTTDLRFVHESRGWLQIAKNMNSCVGKTDEARRWVALLGDILLSSVVGYTYLKFPNC